MYVSCICIVCLTCFIGDMGGQMWKCVVGFRLLGLGWPESLGGVRVSDCDCELSVMFVIDDGVGVGGAAGSAH